MAAQNVQKVTKPGPLSTALRAYCNQGFRVTPLHTRNDVERAGPCSCGRKDCTQDVKVPFLVGWQEKASSNILEIAQLWERYAGSGIGIATGKDSGVIVLDIDNHNGVDGQASLDLAQRKLGELPKTKEVITGSGGRHMYFRHPGGRVANRTGGKGHMAGYPGLDVRGDGGYVVAPPTVHPNGTAYVWTGTKETPIADLPPAWAVFLCDKVEAAPPSLFTASTAAAPEKDSAAFWLDRARLDARPGTRNDTGLWLACQLRDSGLSELEARSTMLEYAAMVTSPDSPYRDSESLATLRQAYKDPPRAKAVGLHVLQAARAPVEVEKGVPPPTIEPKDYHFTMEGNAQRLVDAYGSTLRYVDIWKKWLIWNGKQWKVDTTGRIVLYAKRIIKAIYSEGARLISAANGDAAVTAKGTALVEFSLKCENVDKIKGLLILAQSELAIEPDALDANPMLFNCDNGTLDLATGAFNAHNPLDLITKISPAVYDPAARAPLWLDFIEWSMIGRVELMHYLCRMAGYSLTGDNREQILFILHGDGNNGKSTLLEVLSHVLGGYAVDTPTDTIMRKPNQSSGISNDIARLANARMVTASEPAEGQRLNDELIKQMTGGYALTARFLHAEFFSFTPRFKLWLDTNHIPSIRETGPSMRRRLRLIPFDNKVTEETKDKELGDKLIAEASGILNWCLDGCKDWQANGMGYPVEVMEKTNNYLDDMDTLGHFIDAACSIHMQAMVQAQALYNAYVAWCTEANEHPIGSKTFSQAIANKGFAIDRKSGKGSRFLGIGLASTPPEPGNFSDTFPPITDTSYTSDTYKHNLMENTISPLSNKNGGTSVSLTDSYGALTPDGAGPHDLDLHLGNEVSAPNEVSVIFPIDTAISAKKRMPKKICPSCGDDFHYHLTLDGLDWLCNKCQSPYYAVKDGLKKPLA